MENGQKKFFNKIEICWEFYSFASVSIGKLTGNIWR